VDYKLSRKTNLNTYYLPNISFMKQNVQTSEKYITSGTVRQHYGVSNSTLQRWANEGKIKTLRTNGNHRLYERDSVAKLFGDDSEKKTGRRRVCYARVSSAKQGEDLERQVQDLQREYPDHELIKDIGSGVNFSRKGFKTLVDSILDGDIEELVISHKDRLTRFGYELVEQLCDKFDCKIVVQFKDQRHNPEQDLADDLLAITTVFVAKHNGLRAGEKRRKRKENKETKAKKRRESSEDEGSSTEVPEDYIVPNSGGKGHSQPMDGCCQMDLQSMFARCPQKIGETEPEGIASLLHQQ